MKTLRPVFSKAFVTALVALISCTSLRALAHCDSLDGPVVKAARKALAASNVNLVVIWVQKDDEAQTRRAFEKTLAVRHLNADARDLADLYFFETVVRFHCAGEGEPYNGLKPAGRDLGPAIPAADKALDVGTIEPVTKVLLSEIGHGLSDHFLEAFHKKEYDKDNVEAGRAYVKAYVRYMHYVEALHEAAVDSPRARFQKGFLKQAVLRAPARAARKVDGPLVATRLSHRTPSINRIRSRNIQERWKTQSNDICEMTGWLPHNSETLVSISAPCTAAAH